MMDYPCAKFGDLSFSRFSFIVRTDTHTHTHTHRQTESQMRIIAILTRLPSASVMMMSREIYDSYEVYFNKERSKAENVITQLCKN